MMEFKIKECLGDVALSSDVENLLVTQLEEYIIRRFNVQYTDDGDSPLENFRLEFNIEITGYSPEDQAEFN